MPKAPPLPSEDEMYRALIERNTNYEGLFFFGVKSTGIFCRPDCPAKKPKRQNISFYRTVSDALAAGFRPCKRCQPLHTPGDTPEWLSPILNLVEQDPTKRWTDADLRNCKVEPTRIRRWFKKNHGMTFHAFLRLQRLSTALGQLQSGRRAIYASETNGYGSAAGLREGLKKWLGDYPKQLKHIEPIFVNRILTPLGPMVAAASDSGLCLLEFADRRMLSTQFKRVGRLFSRPITPGYHAFVRSNSARTQ